jgi:hypothetical protein
MLSWYRTCNTDLSLGFQAWKDADTC